MKLELSAIEVQAVLIAYAHQKFPDSFDYMEVDSTYNRVRSITLCKRVEPPVAGADAVEDEPL